MLVEVDDFASDVLSISGFVFVDFFADWCAPCRNMLPIVHNVSNMFPDVRFVKLDIMKHPTVAGDYNVASIPVFMIFKDGKQRDTHIGSFSNQENCCKWIQDVISEKNFNNSTSR